MQYLQNPLFEVHTKQLIAWIVYINYFFFCLYFTVYTRFNGSLNVFKLFPTISSYKLPSIRPSGALSSSEEAGNHTVWLKFNKVGVFPGQTTCCWMLTLNNNWMWCSFSRLQGFRFRRYKFVSAQMPDIGDRSWNVSGCCLWLLVDIFIVPKTCIKSLVRLFLRRRLNAPTPLQCLHIHRQTAHVVTKIPQLREIQTVQLHQKFP